LRFLLDAHVSGLTVGRRLEADGHDVRPLDKDPALDGLGDDLVLVLAAEEHRIVVTQDIGDFPSMLREWAAAARPHAGAIVVYGIDHSEFELIIRGVQRWVELYPDPRSWADLAVSVDRAFASY
jgi:hypothetical protein